MKDEIKKILDRLERIDHKEYIAFEFADSATFDEMARCFEERKKMANYITNLQKENKKQKEILDKIKNNNKRIIDYGFDYDGFNKEEDLKKLIDMLIDYAKQNDKLLEEME